MCYHGYYNRNYTSICYKTAREKNPSGTGKNIQFCNFKSVEKYLNKLKINAKVVKLLVITKLNQEKLKELQLHEKYITAS